jgi:isoleucyl-tRNA synthetase
MATDYKSTLQLPETKFPMRANLPAREAERLEHWEKNDLYGQIISKNSKGQKFILHDGPPYTSGSAHMGTMLNKTYKDFVVRYKALRGFYTPYIPGWDCHGLPTEQRVVAALKEAGVGPLPTAEFRKKCQELSQKNIGIMTQQFARVGVLSDWAHAYKTMDPSYEAETLRAFAGFVEQGLVYRDRKPVMWSIPCKTALADADTIYQEHASPSIWVAFYRQDDPNTAFVIWTTTPWTIPANVAVALNPKFDYVELEHDGKKFIVAEALSEKFKAQVGWTDVKKGKTVKGVSFEGLKLKHPFMSHESRVVLADYVSAEDGTGCVHTAPGHGMEDYMTGRQYKLEIYSPLDDEGKYVNDGRIPANLVGLSTLEKGGKTSPANEAVIAMLKASGHLFAQAQYVHQYPFCDRSKTPIIFRSLEQWFIGLDKNNNREKVLKAIDTVEWIPPQSKNRIRGSVENRMDWCISRQRPWGVPIPAFYDESGRRYIDAQVIRALAKKVEKLGTNIFFEWSAEKLLEGITLPSDWKVDAKGLKQESDTLDVWIESGSSSFSVIKNNPDMSWPADLYLEASDQHRGWFQSSLWVSVVNTGRAPFKAVFTHEWVLDANKQKLSKSKNSMSATEMIKKYGADVLRLWASSQDYTNAIPLTDEVLTHVSNAYASLRNTLRYELANLNGFDASKDAVKPNEMWCIDRWVVIKARELVKDVTAAYDDYDFAKVYQLISRFCQVTLSSIYHDAIKDRVYTCGKYSVERRSVLSALDIVFNILVRLLSPIIPFTADEAWVYRKTDGDFSEESVHLQDWPVLAGDWGAYETVAKDFDELIALRTKTNEKLEGLRKEKIIGKSLEAKLIFKGSLPAPLKIYDKKELSELYIVSEVQLSESTGEFAVEVAKASGYKCPRCWRHVSHAPDVLCDRCERTLKTPTEHTHVSQQKIK